MPYIVALTGGIGSGKSTVTHFFSSYDISIIDADVIARDILEFNPLLLMKIVQYFGSKILLESGRLNRAYLRNKIFSQPNDRIWINQLLYPSILKEIKHQLVQTNSPYVLLVVPLLVEYNLQRLADRVLVIDTDIETQIIRTASRDNITRQQVQDILSAQVTRKDRLAIADDIIDNDAIIFNNGFSLEMKLLVESLHNRYLELAISTPKKVNLYD